MCREAAPERCHQLLFGLLRLREQRVELGLQVGAMFGGERPAVFPAGSQSDIEQLHEPVARLCVVFANLARLGRVPAKSAAHAADAPMRRCADETGLDAFAL